MKKTMNKLSMIAVATVMFGAALFLSMEQNEQSKWEFATVSTYAQSEGGGGEGGEGSEGDDYWWFAQNKVLEVKKSEIEYDASLGLTFNGTSVEIANFHSYQSDDIVGIYNYCSSVLIPLRCFTNETGFTSI